MLRSLLVVFSLLISFCGQAQVQDLAELTDGKFLDFRAVYDKDDALFGYIATYSKDLIDDEHQQVEVILLDKNLNQFLSKEFKDDKSVKGYATFFENQENLVLFPLAEEPKKRRKAKKFIYPASRILNLKTKELNSYTHTCYEDGALIDCPENRTKKQIEKDNMAKFKENKSVSRYKMWRFDNGSLLVNSWEEKYYSGYNYKYVVNENYTLFSENREVKWSYSVKEKASKKDYAATSVISVEDDEVYFIESLWKKGDIKDRKLIGLNAVTGKKILEEDMSAIKGVIGLAASNPFSSRTINNKIISTGIRRNKSTNQIGYYQFIVDKSTHKVDWRSFLYEELKSDLKKVDKYANVEKGFYLRLKAVYPSESGATVVLTEKYKFKTGTFAANAPKTRDFVVMVFDENFEKTDVQVVEKDKTVGSYTDLIFSQYLNDKKDYVFFYRDYRKDDETNDRNWVLGINTVIGGKFKNEEIPMSSEDFFIYPFMAKEGYILLREFNKKSEHNQVRLERLNF